MNYDSVDSRVHVGHMHLRKIAFRLKCDAQ